jgi:NADH:ubiquinone oxidoreductase subunit E
MTKTKKLAIIKHLLTVTKKYGVIEKVNAPELAKKYGVSRQYIYKCFNIYKKFLKGSHL